MKVQNNLIYRNSGTATAGKVYLGFSSLTIGSNSSRSFTYTFLNNPSGTISYECYESGNSTNLIKIFTPTQLAYTTVSYPKWIKNICIIGGFYVTTSTPTINDNVRCNIIVRYNNSSYQEAKASNSTMTHIWAKNSGTVEVALDGTYPSNESLKVFTFLATPLIGDMNAFRMNPISVTTKGVNNTSYKTFKPFTYIQEINLK